MPITKKDARQLATAREWPLVETSLPAAIRAPGEALNLRTSRGRRRQGRRDSR